MQRDGTAWRTLRESQTNSVPERWLDQKLRRGSSAGSLFTGAIPEDEALANALKFLAPPRDFMAEADQEWNLFITRMDAQRHKVPDLMNASGQPNDREPSRPADTAQMEVNALRTSSLRLITLQPSTTETFLKAGHDGIKSNELSPPLCTRFDPHLTVREREVLQLLSTGSSEQEIADALFISPKTVEKHVSKARLKLKAASRTAAVAAAIRLQLI